MSNLPQGIPLYPVPSYDSDPALKDAPSLNNSFGVQNTVKILSANPESHRYNISFASPFQAGKRFECAYNSGKWYRCDQNGNMVFAAELLVNNVIQICCADSEPLAFVVEYKVTDQIYRTVVTLAEFNSDSLWKKFYISNHSSTVPTKVLCALIRYCIQVANYHADFIIPQYM